MGLVNSSEKWGMHAWLEIELPNGNWLEYDPTYHEIGFINATHIKQAVFTDYNEVKNVIKGNFILKNDNYKYKDLFNPLDVNVKIINKINLDSKIKINIKKQIKPLEHLNVCIVNKESNIKIFPIAIQMHNDFSPTKIEKLIFLDNNTCFTFLSPNTKISTKYGYYINLLEVKDENFIFIKPKTSKINILNISPELINNLVKINIKLTSDKNTIINVILDNNEERDFKLITGINNINIEKYTDKNSLLLTLKNKDKIILKTNFTLNKKVDKNQIENMYNYLFLGIGIIIVLLLIIVSFIFVKIYK